MSFYLSNTTARPTGFEPGEFLDIAPMGETGPATADGPDPATDQVLSVDAHDRSPHDRAEVVVDP